MGRTILENDYHIMMEWDLSHWGNLWVLIKSYKFSFYCNDLTNFVAFIEYDFVHQIMHVVQRIDMASWTSFWKALPWQNISESSHEELSNYFNYYVNFFMIWLVSNLVSKSLQIAW